MGNVVLHNDVMSIAGSTVTMRGLHGSGIVEISRSDLTVNGSSSRGDTISLMGNSHLFIGKGDSLKFHAPVTLNPAGRFPEVEFLGLASFGSDKYDFSTGNLEIFSGGNFTGKMIAEITLHVPAGFYPRLQESGAEGNGIFAYARIEPPRRPLATDGGAVRLLAGLPWVKCNRMAENRKIEWTDHTFNPWVGCTKVSPACDHLTVMLR